MSLRSGRAILTVQLGVGFYYGRSLTCRHCNDLNWLTLSSSVRCGDNMSRYFDFGRGFDREERLVARASINQLQEE